MNVQRSQRQSGFALLIFLLMLIGAGGVALANFAQGTLKEVNERKFSHNKRVLQEAKQALLMYVYLYPQTGNQLEGPGRLPCPDTDNDGEANLVALCNTQPGRFPWKEPRMNFYDARDSTNQRLWYAVSDNFYNLGGGPNTVNSEQPGTITVFDQNGSILYDGASNGVAAVIIAPGEPMGTQDRSHAQDQNPEDTTADTYAGIIDPDNYLDSFNNFDNSVFVNSSSALQSDGFIMGPVRDNATNQIVVNDQMIFITSDEVARMAEKAVLDIYKQAIDDYMSKPGITRFPWLYDFATDNMESFSSNRSDVGRIPSIFSRYFTDADSQPVDSELRLQLRRSFLLNKEVSGSTFALNLDMTTATASNVRFSRNTPNDGRVLMQGNWPSNSYTASIYFYDSTGSEDWVACSDNPANPQSGTYDGGQLTHCNRDASGNLTPWSVDNQTNSEILRVGIRVDLSPSVQFDLDVDGLVSGDFSYEDVQPGSDAFIIARFDPDEIIDPMSYARVFYERGDYDTFEAFTLTESNTRLYKDTGNFGRVEGQAVLSSGFGMRFYPEIPAWAQFSRNNWHRAVLMAIANSYQAGGNMDCVASVDCLIIEDKKLTNDSISALLVIAGSNTIIDLDSDYSNDIDQLFGPKQIDGNNIFSASNFDDPNDQADDGILLVRTQ